MEKAEYQKHYELERDFWWFKSRRAAAFRILRRWFQPASFPARILDGGCGTGINLTELDRFGRACGCDLAAEALSFCRQRGLTRLARADVGRLPFRRESFDLVTLFDVLYHQEIPDDVAVMGEVRRVLKEGGLFLMTDSALEILRGPHDEAMQGLRRYNKKILRAKLEGAGFEIVRLSYFFMTTFPIILFKRRLEKRRSARNPGAVPRSDLAPVPGWLNRVLYGVLRLEAAWAARRDLPIGSSIIALARKK